MNLFIRSGRRRDESPDCAYYIRNTVDHAEIYHHVTGKCDKASGCELSDLLKLIFIAHVGYINRINAG